MSEAALVALIQFALKFGLDAAIAIAKAKDATYQDAIKALEEAKTKTADDFLREAKAAEAKALAK